MHLICSMRTTIFTKNKSPWFDFFACRQRQDPVTQVSAASTQATYREPYSYAQASTTSTYDKQSYYQQQQQPQAQQHAASSDTYYQQSGKGKHHQFISWCHTSRSHPCHGTGWFLTTRTFIVIRYFGPLHVGITFCSHSPPPLFFFFIFSTRAVVKPLILDATNSAYIIPNTLVVVVFFIFLFFLTPFHTRVLRKAE